jgi:hypothetical protein
MIIDSEYSRLRKQFERVNKKDPASLRKWFESHSYLSVADHAMVIGMSTASVRKLRKLAGIEGNRPKTKKRPISIKQEIGEVPANWRTKEWLTENTQRYGVKAVQRAVGISHVLIHRILRKLGVPKFGNKSKNPNCTKAWCHKHYVELGLTERQCAKLAGISNSKFSDWLVKFNIPKRVRYLKHNTKRQLSFNYKVALKKLRDHPHVKSIKITKAQVAVTFKDNQVAVYRFSAMSLDDWKINNVPPIIEQYADLTGHNPYPAHIMIPRKDLNNATKLERDLAVHQYNYMLNKRGYIWPLFPDNVIQEDLELLKKTREKDYIKEGCFMASIAKAPGRYIMQHFFDMSEIYDRVLKKPDVCFSVIRDMIGSSNPFDYHHLVKAITRRNHHRFTFKTPNPSTYRYLFQRLNIKGKILDLHTGTGARAIAASLAGCTYVHLDDRRFNKAVDLGFDSFIGLNYEAFNGKVDAVIYDHDFRYDYVELKILDALEYRHCAKTIIVLVPAALKDNYRQKYEPKHIAKVVTNYFQEPNYFFIW